MPRDLSGPSISWPLRNIAPLVGSSSPATSRSTVDLPQPEGPSSAQISPSFTSKDTSRTASIEVPSPRSKRLPTPRTDNFGIRDASEFSCSNLVLPSSEEAQILAPFPLGNRLVEAIPLVLLMGGVEPVHGVAEDVLGERIGGEARDRLIEIARQRLYLPLLFGGQVVERLR